MNALLAAASAALAGFGITALLVEPARRLARRSPTPYLGGLAIVVGTLAPAVLLLRGRADGVFWSVAAASVAVAVLGLGHDLRGLSARLRLPVELLLAALLVVGGARLNLPGPGWLDPALTVAWIVAVTNSFNRLDHADGALAAIGCLTSVPVAVLLFAAGQPHLSLLLVCLAAACGGFLLHYAPPARVLMGDAGSLFVGLLVCAGVTRMPAGQDRPAHLALALALLMVSPVAVRAGLVVASRSREGRPNASARPRLPAAAAPAARAAAREPAREAGGARR